MTRPAPQKLDTLLAGAEQCERLALYTTVPAMTGELTKAEKYSLLEDIADLQKGRRRALPANLQKLPARQSRKSDALARAHEYTRHSSFAAWRYRSVLPNACTHSGSDVRLIILFGAVGGLVPLIILSLEQDLGPYLDSDGLLSALRVFLWPASVLSIGTERPIFTLTSFVTVLLNIATYLVVGSLVWLGLRPRRSITYLTMVGCIYLMLVSVAGFCEWLLT
jgi:hypothetical protein